jgi:hypothetical protein
MVATAADQPPASIREPSGGRFGTKREPPNARTGSEATRERLEEPEASGSLRE